MGEIIYVIIFIGRVKFDEDPPFLFLGQWSKNNAAQFLKPYVILKLLVGIVYLYTNYSEWKIL